MRRGQGYDAIHLFYRDLSIAIHIDDVKGSVNCLLVELLFGYYTHPISSVAAEAHGLRADSHEGCNCERNSGFHFNLSVCLFFN